MTDRVDVYGGVDTHRDVHVAAVVDTAGRVLKTAPFPADMTGYQQMRAWFRYSGKVLGVGVEGTGSYGVGLTRYLTRAGLRVVEVNRPNRQLRRQKGKTDTVDAEAAARAAANGSATAIPKSADGPVEAILLRVTRRSAVKARTQAANQLHAVLINAPAGQTPTPGQTSSRQNQDLRRVPSRRRPHHSHLRQGGSPSPGPQIPNTSTNSTPYTAAPEPTRGWRRSGHSSRVTDHSRCA